MMQDIGVSPISSSFPSNKMKQSSAVIEDHKLFYDHADKNGSSINEEFFRRTGNNENNEDTWNGNLKLPIFHLTVLLLYINIKQLPLCICCFAYLTSSNLLGREHSNNFVPQLLSSTYKIP
jgi:hypothetical protein